MQDCGSTLLTPQEAIGYQRSRLVDRPPVSSGCTRGTLGFCRVWCFVTCSICNFQRFKRTYSKERVMLSSAKRSIALSFSFTASRPRAQHLAPSIQPRSPLFPALAFALVRTKTYSRAGINATVLPRADVYFAFFLSAAISVEDLFPNPAYQSKKVP